MNPASPTFDGNGFTADVTALPPQRDKCPSKTITIASLVNCEKYNLLRVIAVEEKTQRGLWLIVINPNSRTIMSRLYRDLKSLQMGFLKFFKHRAESHRVRPRWTKLYPLEADYVAKITAAPADDYIITDDSTIPMTNGGC